jgi:hypothetical protein
MKGKKQGEVTLPKDPLTETETSNKRKGSPTKPSSWKKSKANKPPFHFVLMVNDIYLIIVSVSNTLEDILQ